MTCTAALRGHPSSRLVVTTLFVLVAGFCSRLADSADALHEAKFEAKIAKCVAGGELAAAWEEELLRESLKGESPAEAEKTLDDCLKVQAAGPSFDRAAVERGRALYKGNGCPTCHGTNAAGSERAPSLMRSQLVMRDKMGETIANVVLKGVPNTAMPAFPLKTNELADVAVFLHSLQSKSKQVTAGGAPSILSGNAAVGRVYFEQRCAHCHSVTTDLKDIGARYPDPQALQQRWLMPKDVPMVALVSSTDGSTVEGRVLHIDEFRVTLGLSDGTLRSFDLAADKSKLVLRDPLVGHRALLPEYLDSDIHDVTAYLATLASPTKAIETARVRTVSQEDLEDTRKPDPTVAPKLPPEALLHPATGSWPTYSGDYSGRRYSTLKQINQSNVRQLALAWITHLTPGPNDSGIYPLITSGQRQRGSSNSPPPNIRGDIRGAILQVRGVLYASCQDNVWAVDARTGQVLWHFNWKSRGGPAGGTRSVGMWGSYLFLETSDAYLVAINADTGRQVWQAEIAPLEEEYWETPAPIVVGNHVLVGAGNILNMPGFVKSFEAQSGRLQWTHYDVPMSPGDPGLESWKNLDVARHGGGQAWVAGSYDPETDLYIYGTGNPTPEFNAAIRGNGEALYTCSIVAIDVETGRMAWYYQISPNDTHDWDAGLTPVLADIAMNGKMRKVVMAAARNGHFFVIDRTTGEHLLTSKYSTRANWAQPVFNDKGQPVRIPQKDSLPSGALVSPANQGTANWYPQSFSPDYGLLYFPSGESWAMTYTTAIDVGGAASGGGMLELAVDSESYLRAIDPKTGRVAWSIRYPTLGRHGNFGMLGQGVLTTAGRLLFADDTVGNLVARDPANGSPLWHINLGKVSNAPETYEIDGQQFIMVAAGDVLYSFTLPN